MSNRKRTYKANISVQPVSKPYILEITPTNTVYVRDVGSSTLVKCQLSLIGGQYVIKTPNGDIFSVVKNAKGAYLKEFGTNRETPITGTAGKPSADRIVKPK